MLDKRRPGQGKFATQRQEPDRGEASCRACSRTSAPNGQPLTTGTPISADDREHRPAVQGLLARSAQAFRPGHADYPYFAKYGVRDYRGGGRSSARETAARVAAGRHRPATGDPGVTIRARPGADRPRYAINRTRDNWDEAHDSHVLLVAGRRRQRRSGRSTWNGIRKAGSSVGAVVEVGGRRACRPAWARRLYGKLDADLAAAMMSINAVKGVEIGDGFAGGGPDAARRTPTRCGRQRRTARSSSSNHAGGVLGGISTGQPLWSAALRRQADLVDPDPAGERHPERQPARRSTCATKGRHDPCVGIRGVPVGEAMTACVLADAFLRHRGPDRRATCSRQASYDQRTTRVQALRSDWPYP
ncbi:chorismate synthase [Caulobacter segnis]